MILKHFCGSPSCSKPSTVSKTFNIFSPRTWLNPRSQKTSAFLFREEVKVLGEMQQVTRPHCAAATTTFAARTAPSATVSSTRAPLEPITVKPEVTLVHVTWAYTDWLTLGLPADVCVPPPTKLLGNRSQHSCPICGDIKSSSDGAYNHIQIEHLGILLQCCFCTWSSGSVRMMQDPILKHHQRDNGSCMIPGLEPAPCATCQ